MARLDVHRSRTGSILLLNVQAEALDHLNTRMVVPLLPPEEAPKPARYLNPEFQVDGRDVVMATQYMAAVPKSELGDKVASLSSNHAEIVTALDMLFLGF